MAHVIAGGSEMFDAAAYGNPNASIYQFIDHHARQISSNLTSAAQTFFQTTKDVYRKVDMSEAMRLARAVTRRVKSLWQPDGIYPLTEIGEFQNANLAMQRWIMAEPTVRTLFHKQLCDGYSDSYVDIYPGVVGDAHYDYRRVMDGVIVPHEERGWDATTYMEDLIPDDVELDLSEKVDIRASWEFIKTHFSKREDDPTSKYNSKLS